MSAQEREVTTGSVAEAGQQMIDASCRVYDTSAEHAALRCALGDAALLCDVIAREMETNARGRRGQRLKAMEMAAVAKRCGDAIWAMRDRIRVSR